MDILLQTPVMIAIGVTVLVAVSLIVFFLMKQKKTKGPVTPASLPPLPSAGEASQHFATTNMGGIAAKKSFLNKNALIGIAVLFNILLIGAVIFIGTISTKQNKATGAKAASTPVTLVQDIGKENADHTALIVGGSFVYTGGGTVPVTITVQNFHCLDNNVSTCNSGNGTKGQDLTATQNVGASPTEITVEIPMDEQCGAYQGDADYTSPNGNGPAGSILKKFAQPCAGAPTPTPRGGTPTVTPTTAAGTCQVSGQVLEQTAATAQCPTTGTGMNNVQVSLWGINPTPGQPDVSMSTVSAVGGSGQNGAFYFQNVPKPGIYNVCVAVMPAGYKNLCNTPRDDGHDPFTTTCAKIDTSKQCAGIRLNLLKTGNTTPTPTPTTAPSTCQVSGQVLNIGTEHPASCPTVGGHTGDKYAGMNGVTVEIWGINPTPGQADIYQTTTTIKGGSQQDGAFYFQNIPAKGMYNVCVKPVPSGYSNLCNLPRDDGHDPFTTTCAKIDTSKQCAGIRLDLNTVATTPSPSVSPSPTATCIPRPPCLDATPACDIPVNPNYCPPTTPTVTPTKPTGTVTPTPTGSLTPTPTGSLTPTPTTQIVYITATPTPGASGTAVITNTPTANPTIPSVGVPLPAVAVIIPVILMGLAFIL
jgi:hypothetical protein